MRNVIGNNIKKIRIEKGLSQLDLSARLEIRGILIDRPMISKIENQKREITDYEILGFIEVLETSLQELFKGVSL